MAPRTTSPSRGARGLHLRDWPFGGVGRRLLLEALLIDDQPDMAVVAQAASAEEGIEAVAGYPGGGSSPSSGSASRESTTRTG